MTSQYVISVSRLVEASKARPAGYLEDCLSAGEVSKDGRTVSFEKARYDALVSKYKNKKTQPLPSSGPGTELKKLLAKVGITATENCSCNARAKTMDENEAREPGWCEANLDTIVGWLREEATKRKLPFLDAAGRLLVRRAIANAKRNA